VPVLPFKLGAKTQMLPSTVSCPRTAGIFLSCGSSSWREEHSFSQRHIAMPPTSRAFAQSSGATSAYARHLQAASAYVSYYGGTVPTPAKYRSERDILEDHHQFIRTDEETDTEEKRIAKSYYDKLFKEFAMVELARWREKQVSSHFISASRFYYANTDTADCAEMANQTGSARWEGPVLVCKLIMSEPP